MARGSQYRLNMNRYPNDKVEALMRRLCEFEPEDFVALAIACLDQAGYSARVQKDVKDTLLKEQNRVRGIDLGTVQW